MTYIEDILAKKRISYWKMNKTQLNYRKNIIEENLDNLEACGVNTTYHLVEINGKLEEIKRFGE